MFDAMKLLGSMLQGQATPATAGRFDMAAQSMNYAPPLLSPSKPLAGSGTWAPARSVRWAARLLGDSGPGIIGGGLLAIVGNLAVQALQSHLAAGARRRAAAPAMGRAPANAGCAAQSHAVAARHDPGRQGRRHGRPGGDAADHRQDPTNMGTTPPPPPSSPAEMSKPIDLAGLCRDVANPQEAVEVYAASVMVLDVDSQAERDYLEDLANNLGIAPPVVAQIHRQLGIA